MATRRKPPAPVTALLALVLPGATVACARPDRAPPTLTSTRVHADPGNVWVFAPITLVFSEPLAAASVVPEAFELRPEGQAPVPLQVRLAPDRRAVQLRVERPPRSPATVVLAIGSGLRDEAGNAFAGAHFSWQLPVWQDAGPPTRQDAEPGWLGDPAAAYQRAPDGTLDLLIAWPDGRAQQRRLRVARLGQPGQASDPAGWSDLGPPIPLADGPPTTTRLAVTADGLVVAWIERDDLQLRRWDGTTWRALGAPAPDGAATPSQPALVAREGALFAAWLEGDRQIHVARWADGTWRPVGQADAAAHPVVSYDLAVQAGRPVLALAERGGVSTDLIVRSWDEAAGWQTLGAPLDRLAADDVGSCSLAVGPDGTLAVAWQEHDGSGEHVYVARWVRDGADPGRLTEGTWTLVGAALDLDIDARATAPRLQIAPSGAPLVAWQEQAPGQLPVHHVARWTDEAGWQVMGAFPAAGPSGGTAALTLDDAGQPTLVTPPEGPGSLRVHRFNGTPELPFGLALRAAASASPCRLPEETDATFPRSLSATGCFSDLARRQPAAGVVPYDVVSELWSDGAHKRRFIVLPEGAAFTSRDHDSWETPPGTLFIKEFAIERPAPAGSSPPSTLVPVETRFLVKRCEEGDCENPWQGYSYQWNDAGTDATLLTNSSQVVFKDWPTATGTHRHVYPSQTQCGQCHLLASGGVLGIQTAQLDRSFDYGDLPDNHGRALEQGALADNQLRALEHAGLVRRPPATRSPPGSPRQSAGVGWILPAPHDVSQPLEQRVRAYFQGNCAHCHRPGGSWPLMDFRHHVPLATSRLCQLIKPGQAINSRLYHKSQTRDTEQLPDGTTGQPMPPIGSLLLDQRQLADLRSWIDALTTCP
jgi:hypothetical protein